MTDEEFMIDVNAELEDRALEWAVRLLAIGVWLVGLWGVSMCIAPPVPMGTVL